MCYWHETAQIITINNENTIKSIAQNELRIHNNQWYKMIII